MMITKNQINLYKNHLIGEEKYKVTIEKYIRDITAFSEWLADGELSKIIVLEYKNRLIEKYAPASDNTGNRILCNSIKYTDNICV